MGEFTEAWRACLMFLEAVKLALGYVLVLGWVLAFRNELAVLHSVDFCSFG